MSTMEKSLTMMLCADWTMTPDAANFLPIFSTFTLFQYDWDSGSHVVSKCCWVSRQKRLEAGCHCNSAPVLVTVQAILSKTPIMYSSEPASFSSIKKMELFRFHRKIHSTTRTVSACFFQQAKETYQTFWNIPLLSNFHLTAQVGTLYICRALVSSLQLGCLSSLSVNRSVFLFVGFFCGVFRDDGLVGLVENVLNNPKHQLWTRYVSVRTAGVPPNSKCRTRTMIWFATPDQ